jgi:hypothetical protein
VNRMPSRPALFLTTVAVMLAVGWLNEHDSCLRSQHTRSVQAQIVHRLGLPLDVAAPPLNCSKPLPDH